MSTTATESAAQTERQELERQVGKIWSTEELREEFEVIGFAAPFTIVKRKADGKLGTVQFQHMPRFYFDFRED